MSGDLVELEVLGVRRQSDPDQVVVLLLDVEGRRLLPVVVGPVEGAAIAAGHAGLRSPRPMTHDLLVSVLEACGVRLSHVEVTALLDGVFHAALVLADGARVDSRASDAIATAVRVGCPVRCVPGVLEEAGLPVQEHTPEEQVAEFRAFLDAVDPEDFVRGQDPGAPPGTG
ncbi:bifunctional nuclease family protein [Actinotalea sp.]|uniref:bifunctional nuclease family protein n=1 Tax=Actinotalea sp. TaxID=1872145 RepID=UPI002BDFF39B|nr:bifunctional nuclease family protein [Actinotalea sp.]HQY32640.1 bifunctional nuclease family protein [Actinotalea sp.]HRA49899.1 bifunctional nuclease family protein [Actinotalea sp.]